MIITNSTEGDAWFSGKHACVCYQCWSAGSSLGCGFSMMDRLVDLVSGRSRVRIPLAPGFLSGSSHTGDFKIGTPVATLPGAWHYRVGAGTGRPGVSIL